VRRSIAGWGLVGVALFAAACSSGSKPGAPLASVDALPKPTLPSWIASVSPLGPKAQNLAQIRVIFNKPVTKVESLSGAGPQDVLSHVSITPALAGHFVVLTPRMIGFVADQALPIGTRARVTLGAGLKDLDGDALASDLSWTFETESLAFTGLPVAQPTDGSGTPAPVSLRPTIKVNANAKVDEASLASHLALTAGGDTVPVTVKIEVQPTPYPGSDSDTLFDPSLGDWTYDITPSTDLKTGTAYAITIAQGVLPAYGNVPSQDQATGGIHTYGNFALSAPQPTPGSGGRFAKGDPVIAFTNPIDPTTIAAAISVSPAPASVKSLAIAGDDASTIAIDPYALDPNKTYTITIAPTLKDTFGQTLSAAQTVTVATSDFTPGAWAPSGTSTIAAGAGVKLNFYATNLPNNGYNVAFAHVPAAVLLNGSADPMKILPDRSAWSPRTLPGAKTNAQSVVEVPLAQQIGAPYGALAYGFETKLDSPDSSPSNVGIAQLTNLGVFAQYFPQSANILVQHLSDGAPAPGVALTIYRLGTGSNSSALPQQCAAGTSDPNGSFTLSGPALESCYAGSSKDNAPSLGLIATEGSDTATLQTQSYSGVYHFSVAGGWTGGAPLPRGVVFTDRSMYQPGERGELTGLAYYASNGVIAADRNATYNVTLTDPQNATTSLGSVMTDAYGVFSLPIAFSKSQSLGYYTVDAKGANGNDINGSLRIAEFKPPNFKLDLTLDNGTNAVAAGGSVQASLDGAYLFGAPLQGGVAHAVVTRYGDSYSSDKFPDYSFGPQWFEPDQSPDFDSDVSQNDYTLDAQGKAAFPIPVPTDLPFPMTYNVDVQTTDVSNLSVASGSTFTALPTDAIIGLDSDVVGPASSPMPIRVIVLDAKGAVVAGRAVHLELQKMTYVSATQQVDGGDQAQDSIKYDTVATTDTTSAADPVTVTLAPTDPGPYRVRANFGGSTNVATASDIQVFAYGGNTADWGTTDLTTTPLKLDKKTYKVGDTATALVASPFAQSDVYVSVVRNNALYRTTMKNVKGSPRFTFRITQDMLPNAAVEAVVVRRGANLQSVKPGSLSSLATVGMAGFDVSVADRYLALDIAPANAKVTPGAGQSVNFTLKTKGGAAAQGEVVAMVVNDAILQLTGYRLPDLVQTVFADQPISTIFSDSRDGIILSTQTPPSEKGFGFGGGFLGGAGSTRVRAHFLPMAYYGRVKTDASGHATMSFTMPDDLTTWRVMAVAVGGDDAHFVTNDATFISSQPLITNPLLPQFARPADTFGAGVSVSNQTGADGALGLVLKLTGSLTFATGDPQSQTASEQGTAAMSGFRFPVVVGTPGPTTFQVASTLGSNHDAFNVPFTVVDASSTDSVIETGATAKTASVPIGLDKGGFLNLTLANSIVPQFAVPADEAMSDDWLPLADSAASRIIISSALQGLQAPYKLKLGFDPAAMRADGLQKLLSLQMSDGGFQSYAKAKGSDPFSSAYALEALAFAKKHGGNVDASAVSRAASYASQLLANPGRNTWCNEALCKAQVRFEMLWALAQNGDRRTDFLSDIVAQSDNFDSATQIRLARYLLQTSGWQGQGAKMADHLQQTLYVTGRYAVANVTTRWGWRGSLSDAQSEMLQLLLERHASAELQDGAVRALVAQQCRCGWPTLDDTASAMSALSAYAATEHLGPASVGVTVGGKTVASAQFGSTASSQTFTLAASALSGNAIVITSNGGTVHYTILYTYNVPSDAPGELSAFRVIRTVAEPGPTSSPLATMDLAAVTPVSLGASKVYDIGVRVIVDHPVDRLVVEDPLPAGFEAVDASFRTTSGAVTAQADSWSLDSQTIYRDKVVTFADHLEAGIYDIHYLVRSVTPGTFRWPGAKAYLQDAPEQFGRSASTTLTITQQ
jgi:alpha-2-macroglobulin